MSLLTAREVSKRYGPVVALRSATLVVEPGEVHALLGANGAGKSTLVKVLTGVIRADDGLIEVNGERAKRSRMVQAGDRVRIRSGPYEHLITIRGVSERRGSAPIAQALYEEDPESRKAREAMAAHVRAMNASTGYDSGRPTKKDRRDISRIKGRD